ncbi:hypothetical protein ACFOTA_18115 [Chitinophaga sp. GCM10012297]|uniref:Uncharacterized protein n=1 Tax=Chitinophaga chungangae TaxID=2821488 RepID=A0ABS3YHH7_9BACT|nr:hypothetical protein [Chitinophaga chungangae]MBO9154136.1 hypothetical protein [Chitinophaga chungangae]
MESVKLLDDVIEDLLERGYSLGFGALAKGHVLLAKDFAIDEIVRCWEYDHAAGMIYVFAISSVKYGVKGIVVNAIREETAFTYRQVFSRIKCALLRLFRVTVKR